MAGDTQFQLVTFHLGEELYGVNIMDVKEIVKVQSVRVIPNAPYYVEGIINLRGEIIPIIALHKRFNTLLHYCTNNPIYYFCFLLGRSHGESSSFSRMLGSVFTLKGGISWNLL